MNSRSEYWNWALLITVGILFFAKLVFAQPQQQKPGPPEIPDSSRIVQMVKHLASDLVLTKEQKNKILKMHLRHFKDVKKAMKEFKGKMDEHKKEMDAKREKFENEIKAVLTNDQKIKFEKFLSQRPGPKNTRKKNSDL